MFLCSNLDQVEKCITLYRRNPIIIFGVEGKDLSMYIGYTGKIYHFGYLWHVTPHDHSGIYHHGKRRMSRTFITVANKSQMHLLCINVTNDTFPSIAKDRIIWQSVLKTSIVKVARDLLILIQTSSDEVGWKPIRPSPWHRVSYATVIQSGITSLCITRFISEKQHVKGLYLCMTLSSKRKNIPSLFKEGKIDREILHKVHSIVSLS